MFADIQIQNLNETWLGVFCGFCCTIGLVELYIMMKPYVELKYSLAGLVYINSCFYKKPIFNV